MVLGELPLGEFELPSWRFKLTDDIILCYLFFLKNEKEQGLKLQPIPFIDAPQKGLKVWSWKTNFGRLIIKFGWVQSIKSWYKNMVWKPTYDFIVSDKYE